MSDEQGQSKFEGWAHIEIMGHSQAAGFVTTDYFGTACLFRIDTPALEEREFTLEKPEYVGSNWTPAGAKVRRPASPARTKLIGPSSIFSLNPCTEEVARQMIERLYPRPLILLEMPKQAQLTAAKPICSCEDEDCPNHNESCGVEAAGIGVYPTECEYCRKYHEAEDEAV